MVLALTSSDKIRIIDPPGISDIAQKVQECITNYWQKGIQSIEQFPPVNVNSIGHRFFSRRCLYKFEQSQDNMLCCYIRMPWTITDIKASNSNLTEIHG